MINDKKSIFNWGGKGLEVSGNKKYHLQVILLNGNWNSYSHNTNNYVQPEMHNVHTQEFTSLQNTIFKSVGEASSTANDAVSSDSGIESDCTDGNLSWLLNYKIRELPPFPGWYFLKKHFQILIVLHYKLTVVCLCLFQIGHRYRNPVCLW